MWSKLSIFPNGNICKIGATLLCLALLGGCFYLKAVLTEEYPPYPSVLPAPPRHHRVIARVHGGPVLESVDEQGLDARPGRVRHPRGMPD